MKTAKQHKTIIKIGVNDIHICPGCGESIDLEVCWCGDLIRAHGEIHSNHTAIPMGCNCGKSKP